MSSAQRSEVGGLRWAREVFEGVAATELVSPESIEEGVRSGSIVLLRNKARSAYTGGARSDYES